jgi:hypothetical protein|tara:strand:- start:67 stop:444 length:378 start_codon:yes stop_codon:yes gene_type:complete
MTDSDKTTSNIVNDATYSNTAAGTTFRGDFEPERDRTGKIVYTSNLKVRTLQVERTFPAVITAATVAKIAKASQKLEQILNVQEGVDYRLSGEPTEFEGTDELPPSKVAYYKPVVLRDTISLSMA